MGDRRTQILEHVIAQQRVEVGELADRFAVSRVTVRKDLDHLEERGLIRRQHGYAEAIAPDDLRSRLAFHYDVKRRIAAAAATLVPNGATVMIESGSCCALLAEELGSTRRGVTIITNSAFIADHVRTSHASVVLLGGDYQPESQVVVGPLVEQGAANFYVDRLFIGIDGYTEAAGFTGGNHLRAAAVRAMAQRARQVVVLTESLKFPRQGAVPLLPVDAVTEVVTDSSLTPALADHLRHAGATVTTVPSDPTNPREDVR